MTPKEWAKQKRRELIKEMGGVCTHVETRRTIGGTREVHCDRQHRLEFHHTGERTWTAAKKSRWMRVVLYRKDWQAKILVLLCKKHHNLTKKGNPR